MEHRPLEKEIDMCKDKLHEENVKYQALEKQQATEAKSGWEIRQV